MLLLIDGNSMLYTSFYATVPKDYFAAKNETDKQKAAKNIMQNSNGVFTNGVYTMTKKIQGLMRSVQPEYIAVAWDSPQKTFRKEIFEGYKKSRDKKPEIYQQVEIMQNVLDAMEIYQCSLERFEADDIIGTLARRFQHETARIITKDIDILQVVTDQIYAWIATSKAKELAQEYGNPVNIPNNSFEFNPGTVKAVHGVSPAQIADKKALAGDSSDDIPGVSKIGEKTALSILNVAESIEELYDFIGDLAPGDKEFEFIRSELGIGKAVLNSLIDGKEDAYLSKQLATIADVPLEAELSELRCPITHTQEAEKVFRELEFKSLIA